MFEAVKDGAGLVKSVNRDPSIVDKDRALAMATIVAAENLGIDDQVGSLEVGKRGDLIAVDLTRPHCTPVLNVVAALAYSARGSDVTHVLVDGEVVVRDRQCTRIDPAPLIERVSNRSRELAENHAHLRHRLSPQQQLAGGRRHH
jgi:5-methylthioadenosine/S-adenosylhomocysteine deaminase